MFDPALPAANSALSSAVMRAQLTGLKTLIDAVPGLTAVVIESVITLPPGSAATVSALMSGTVLHLDFGIPAGEQGPAGMDGNDGVQGPPFATAVVDGVSTLPPGSGATVSAELISNEVHFQFGIPEGQPGPAGADGVNGEVTTEQLDSAIGTTSANSNGVDTLDTAFADPDDEVIRAKINELVLALRR